VVKHVLVADAFLDPPEMNDVPVLFICVASVQILFRPDLRVLPIIHDDIVGPLVTRQNFASVLDD